MANQKSFAHFHRRVKTSHVDTPLLWWCGASTDGEEEGGAAARCLVLVLRVSSQLTRREFEDEKGAFLLTSADPASESEALQMPPLPQAAKHCRWPGCTPWPGAQGRADCIG